jgi:hypothetical protein
LLNHYIIITIILLFSTLGIYDHDTIYDTYIDILKIPELAVRKTTPELELGGGTNLHDFIEIMEGLAKTDPNNYTYGKQFGIHLRKVIFRHTAYL